MMIKFYRDHNKMPRATGEDTLIQVAKFLESDVQEANTGRAMLEVITSRNSEAAEVNGNAFSVTVDEDQAIIEPLFDEEASPLTLPASDLEKLLTAWIEFLENPQLITLAPSCPLSAVQH